MQFVLSARTLSEWEGVVTHAVDDIGKKLWKSILEDAALVKERGATSIRYSYYPEWWDGKQEARIDACELVIYKDCFWFEGYVKNSDPPISVETDPVYFADVEFVDDGEYNTYDEDADG